MTDNKKPGSNTTGWAGVGDSAEGIRNLRPDVLRQTRENIKAVDPHIKQKGSPTVSASVTSSTSKPKGK